MISTNETSAPAMPSQCSPETALLVTTLNTFLDGAEACWNAEAPSLTSMAKRRAAKPRKGAEKIIRSVAQVVEQHRLDSHALNAAEMMRRLADAEALQQVEARFGAIYKRLGDERFNAKGDAWGMALQFYSLFKTRALKDGELAGTIAPLKQTFAYRHRTVKAGKPTKIAVRAKTKLSDALALAERNDVSLDAASEPAPTAVEDHDA
jgi:hypothetical protein